MLKKKYLHRRHGDKNDSKKWSGDKFKRRNNIDFFSDLPQHESMRQLRRSWSDFDLTPLYEFLKSKVGCDWDDVYSELLKKVKNSYRYSLDDYLKRISVDIIYDDEFLPRDRYGRILSDRLFVDMNNILTRKSKEEIVLDSKKMLRNQKLKEIMENSKQDSENQSSD